MDPYKTIGDNERGLGTRASPRYINKKQEYKIIKVHKDNITKVWRRMSGMDNDSKWAKVSPWRLVPCQIPTSDAGTRSRQIADQNYMKSSAYVTSSNSLHAGHHPNFGYTLSVPGIVNSPYGCSEAYYRNDQGHYTPNAYVPPATGYSHVLYYNNPGRYSFPESYQQFTNIMVEDLLERAGWRGKHRGMIESATTKEEAELNHDVFRMDKELLACPWRMYTLVYNWRIMGEPPRPLDKLLSPFQVIRSMMGYSLEEAIFGKEVTIKPRRYGIVGRERWRDRAVIPSVAIEQWMVLLVQNVHSVLIRQARIRFGEMQKLPSWECIQESWRCSWDQVHRLWYSWPGSWDHDVRAEIIHWMFDALGSCTATEEMEIRLGSKVNQGVELLRSLPVNPLPAPRPLFDYLTIVSAIDDEPVSSTLELPFRNPESDEVSCNPATGNFMGSTGWEDLSDQDIAAATLQAICRGYPLRRGLVCKKRLAVTVQAMCRGRRMRLVFLQKKGLAIMLQAIRRGIAGRSLAARRYQSASTLQAIVRGGSSRSCFLMKKKIAIIMQAVHRGIEVRRCEIVRRQGIVKLQALARGLLSRCSQNQKPILSTTHLEAGSALLELSQAHFECLEDDWEEDKEGDGYAMVPNERPIAMVSEECRIGEMCKPPVAATVAVDVCTPVVSVEGVVANNASVSKIVEEERSLSHKFVGTDGTRKRKTDTRCLPVSKKTVTKKTKRFQITEGVATRDYKESESVQKTNIDTSATENKAIEFETKVGKTTKSGNNEMELNHEKSTESGWDDQKANAVTERPGMKDTDLNESSKQPDLQTKHNMGVVGEDETPKSNLPVAVNSPCEDKSDTQPTNGTKGSQKTNKGGKKGPKKKEKKAIKHFKLPKGDRDLYAILYMPECEEEEKIVFDDKASSAACKQRRGKWTAGGKDWVNDCRRAYNSMCLLHCRMNYQGLIGEGWEEEDALAVVVRLKMHPQNAVQRGDVEACMATWLGSVEAKQAVEIVGQVGAALRGRGIWTMLEEKTAIDKAWDEVDAAMKKKGELDSKAYGEMYYGLREKYKMDNRRKNVAKIVEACFLEQAESCLMCKSEVHQFVEEL